MAIPTISGVSPTSGSAAGGNVITITGTGFRIPTLSFAIPTPDVTPTVAVTVNGVAAARVSVLSATRVDVTAPRFVGQPTTATFLPVSIILTNLDDAGLAIPGETVTRASAYTYVRWALGMQRKYPPMLQVLEVILRRLMSEVTQFVSVQTHSDYGEDGAIEVDLAELPSVGIRLSTPIDTEWRQWDTTKEEIDRGDGTFDIYDGRETHMLILDLTLAASIYPELMQLEQAVTDFVNQNPMLEVAADVDLYPGATDEIPLEVSQTPQQASNPNIHSLSASYMQIRARGIPYLLEDKVLTAHEMATFILSQVHMSDETDDGTVEHTTF